MAIYLDPPMWPAHGTLFAHLISDTSLDELHVFAAEAGIAQRAFDLDHYDVAAHRCAELAERGARQVDAGTLVRILAASGLRIPARERNGSVCGPLRRRWQSLLPGEEALGEKLLKRWGEPHRRYHDRTHLLAVLEALDTLADHSGQALPRSVILAAWFHDAVYDGEPGRDEQRSAEMAQSRLRQAGLPADEAAEAARLVALTKDHSPEPGDVNGALLCDADLAVLGRDTGGYKRYVRAVRQEYAHVSDADFAAGRAAVVRGLLRLEPLYATPGGQNLWERQARDNLHTELTALTRSRMDRP